jgi:hypothetical protein
MLASVLVSNVPFAPVATKLPLGEETLCKSFPVVDTVVHVRRSALVNMFPLLPTATYIGAPDTSPKAMLFILGPAAPPLGTGFADNIHVLPSALVRIEPSVPSAMNWLPENVTALRSLTNPSGIDVAGVHAVTPGGFGFVLV